MEHLRQTVPAQCFVVLVGLLAGAAVAQVATVPAEENPAATIRPVQSPAATRSVGTEPGRYGPAGEQPVAALVGTTLPASDLAPPRADAPPGEPTGLEESPGRPAIAGRRIVKHFDFDERRFGNYDPLPMSWRRNGEAGFPQYLEGRFDFDVGRQAAPSFRLQLDGGSLCYHYEGRDISVRTNSDYLVVAYIKTHRLDTSRAYFTAYYLDRKGRLIAGTERRSELVGGPQTPDEFIPLTVGLPGNVAEARYVGVSLWLTQASIWYSGPRAVRFIRHEDVNATAWFDDVTVYRLPRVVLRSAHPGNAFKQGEPVVLHTEVTDPDGLNLSAALAVRSIDGQWSDRRVVPIQSEKGQPGSPLVYEKLPSGLYLAELVVGTGETVLVRRGLRFACLATAFSPPADTGRGFGLVLRDMDTALLPGQHDLLQHLRPEFVKLPLWCARRAVVNGLTFDAARDQYLEAIVGAGADPIAILADDLPGQDTEAGSVRSMMDILSETPLSWKPLIADLWARYAGLVLVWQVGGDADAAVFLDERLPDLVPRLRREMRPLMSQPLLASTTSAHYLPAARVVSDYVSIDLPATLPPHEIAGQVRGLLGDDPRRTWLTVEPLDESRYPRALRLNDLGRRLGEAYALGVGGVFLNAPWDTQTGLLTTQVDPREDFIILRTFADVLGGTTPVSRTRIDGQAECLVFDRNGRAVMLVWDDYAPPDGTEHILNLGPDPEQIDLWGRRSKIESVADRQIVRIGPMPTFIVNTPTWLIEFRRYFRIEPPLVEASFEASRRDLVLRNTYNGPITGVARLFVPDNWEIRPNRIPFSLQPGEELRRPVEIRFPQNAQAGIKAVVGDFSIDATNRYQIITPAWFELGLEKVDLQTFLYRVGPRVVVRTTITNRTPGPISFQGHLIAPGRQRINSTFATLRPGGSLSKDFLLENASNLTGQKVRVGVTEIQGTRVWNRVLTVP